MVKVMIMFSELDSFEIEKAKKVLQKEKIIAKVDKDELHEAVFINLSEEVLISYKSTELGVSVLIDNMRASGFSLLDSSIYYKVYKSSGI